MKLHRIAPCVLFIFALLSQAASSQDLSYWVKVAPTDEQFSVLMPPPVPESRAQKNSYGRLAVDTTLYSRTESEVVYTVWSLTNRNYKSVQPPLDDDEYLDECAELVWESLLRARRDRLASDRSGLMSYQREFRAGEFEGREYLLRLGAKAGVVRLFASGEKIYVLTVINAGVNEAGAQRFLNSFEPDREKPQSAQTDAANKEESLRLIRGGPGRGGAGSEKEAAGTVNSAEDYNRVFAPKEVSQRARITARPEPAYTESARKYLVSGTVILRAVLAKTGEITDITVVRGLPHGLTRSSINALKQIRFAPALKDGVQVSQGVTVEYNYNLY